MVDSSRLTLATYLIREEVQLRLMKFDWPQKLEFSVFDFEVSIWLAGKRFVGRGVHSNESIALEKAIGESFERSLGTLVPGVSDFGGIAVHTDLRCAIEAAQLELIERDAFFSHFLTSTPFIYSNDLADSALGERLMYVGQGLGITVKDYSLCAPEGYFVSAVLLFGTCSTRIPFGVRVGLGCSHQSQKMALEKAIYEVLPMFSMVALGGDFKTMEADELLSQENPQPEHHRMWALNCLSVDSMAGCTSVSYDSLMADPLDLSLIATEQLSTPRDWPSILPLVAVGARHPIAVKNYFGGNQVVTSFKQRLEQFSGQPFEELAKPLLPHPLG